MNIDNLIILNETIVERLLDTFKEDFYLRQQFKSNRPAFEKHIIELFRKYNIHLSFEHYKDPQNDLRDVSGYHHSPTKTITITYPRRGVKIYEVMSVIFHEYVHYLKDDLLDGKFDPNKDNSNYIFPINSKALYNPYGIYGLFLERKNPEFLMNKMLKYWTQPHERTNVAFTIAYDIYYDTRPFKSDTIDYLLDQFLEIWKKYHETGQHSEIEHCMNKIKLSSGSMSLLSIVFYRQELTSKRQLAPELVSSIPRTLDLIKKYYRRIGGILNTYQNW